MKHDHCTSLYLVEYVVRDGFAGFDVLCTHGKRWYERDPEPVRAPVAERCCTYCGAPALQKRRKCADHTGVRFTGGAKELVGAREVG